MAEKTANDGFWARNTTHFAKPFYPLCKEFLRLVSGVNQQDKLAFIEQIKGMWTELGKARGQSTVTR